MALICECTMKISDKAQTGQNMGNSSYILWQKYHIVEGDA